MKIFLPFEIKGIGGTATFALKFKEGMEKLGHEVFFEYRPDYDVLFAIVQAPFSYLLDAKRRKKKIVQRLDGMWYWTVAGFLFPLYNLKAALMRHFFTDTTIYQSKYSRSVTRTFLGAKYPEHSHLIYNGVDGELFSPEGERHDLRDFPTQALFFTASAFRREDQIIPLLQALEIYRTKYGENFKCVVAGTFTANLQHIPHEWSHFKQLTFLGKIENKDLGLYERASDVFLFTHLNPPCPNNIIEAMACGLPICGVADGAMPELVTHGQNGLLIPAEGSGFWKTRSLDLEAFADNLALILKNKESYSAKSREKAKASFSLEQMISLYAKALE